MFLVKRAHEFITKIVRPTDCVIDATIGNGYDTLFLAQLINNSGHVYGFDIQKVALVNTADLLQKHRLAHKVTLIQRGHQYMSDYFARHTVDEVSAIMFNLGYLPHGDKSIMTTSTSSVSAVTQSLLRVKNGGIVTIIAYPGHEGGRSETQTLQQLIRQLDRNKFQTQTITGDTSNNNSPLLFTILKK
ncbi:MAG: class I SAM-dependent methyltransferase [Thiohalomonadales bacterium]